jgi:hypothetical protein
MTIIIITTTVSFFPFPGRVSRILGSAQKERIVTQFKIITTQFSSRGEIQIPLTGSFSAKPPPAVLPRNDSTRVGLQFVVFPPKRSSLAISQSVSQTHRVSSVAATKTLFLATGNEQRARFTKWHVLLVSILETCPCLSHSSKSSQKS